MITLKQMGAPPDGVGAQNRDGGRGLGSSGKASGECDCTEVSLWRQHVSDETAASVGRFYLEHPGCPLTRELQLLVIQDWAAFACAEARV